MNRRLVLWLGGLLCVAAARHVRAADMELHGAGATFPYPVYALWGAEYKRATGVSLAYEPVGSGAGVAAAESGSVDFGASDIPLSAEELQRLGAMQFPVVIGGVVPVVNLTGIKPGQLRLSGPVLADIYLGKITRWNAPAIAGLNPGLDLPSSRIAVIHRADSSGTTHLWSDFLARSSVPWRMAVGVGKTLAWPAGVAEVAATGNEGVAASVQRTRASIGYVEYAYAARHHLATASLRNHDGLFVQATKQAFEAACVQARWRDEADLPQSLIDLPGPGTWPVVSASFVLLPMRPAQPSRTREVVRFFDWALVHGQAAATELGYLPLPDAAVQLVRRSWAAHIREEAGPERSSP